MYPTQPPWTEHRNTIPHPRRHRQAQHDGSWGCVNIWRKTITPGDERTTRCRHTEQHTELSLVRAERDCIDLIEPA
jgi:hypothetical protein